ncbi:MAG: hypothetical protein ACYSR5_09190 [Planctomycetota bacterium]|jgi:hypothetical protein
MWNLCEQPWTLIAVAVVTLIVLLAMRSQIQEKKRLYLWLLPILIAAAAFALDYFVKTDLEKITELIDTVTNAVQDENPQAIEPLIAENYSDSYHSNKKELIYYCRRKFSEPIIEKNIKRIISIDISDSRATATFTVRIIFDKQSYIYQSFARLILTKAKIDLEKQDDRWLITRAELLEVDMQPFTWKDIKQTTW